MSLLLHHWKLAPAERTLSSPIEAAEVPVSGHCTKRRRIHRASRFRWGTRSCAGLADAVVFLCINSRCCAAAAPAVRSWPSERAMGAYVAQGRPCRRALLVNAQEEAAQLAASQ